jgi:hypothetical protein
MKNPGFGMGKRGLLGGAGKGDKSRVTNTKEFDKNFSEIDFGRGPGVPATRLVGKTTKRYGTPAVTPFERSAHISIAK